MKHMPGALPAIDYGLSPMLRHIPLRGRWDGYCRSGPYGPLHMGTSGQRARHGGRTGNIWVLLSA